MVQRGTLLAVEMAEERKGGGEVPVQASGFATLGMGDNVVVQQSNGSWKPGTIVDCYDAYTVMYMDGKHSILNRKAFTIQRIVRPSRIEPGMDVLIPTNAEDVRCDHFLHRAYPHCSTDVESLSWLGCMILS